MFQGIFQEMLLLPFQVSASFSHSEKSSTIDHIVMLLEVKVLCCKGFTLQP